MIDISFCKSDRFVAQGNLDLAARTLRLRFEGDLDEQVKLKPLFDYISNMAEDIRVLKLDLAGIQQMTSAGVREWLFLIEKLRGSQRAVSFECLSEPVLFQVNQFPEILGKNPKVALFEIPFHCAKCRTREVKVVPPKALFPRGRTVPLKPVLPEYSCETCAGALVFDEIEKEYFSFLSRLDPSSFK